MGILLKSVATGIGLASEKYHDHKERKAALKTPEAVENHDVANDEQDWALDEAAGDPPQYEEVESYANGQTPGRPAVERTISDLVHDAVPARSEALRVIPDRATKLPYPVIIPQRRPGNKKRGFARAYAPDLEAFGIDEETFCRFLNNFDESSKASPWLNALFVSAGIVGLVPGVTTMAVAISVQVAAGTAIELQSRYRANAFLDQMNKELFMPLGLYAMVLINKPQGPGSAETPAFGVETVNLQTAKNISKWGLPKQNNQDNESDLSKSTQIFRPIRLASGKTKEAMMPLEVAPLIYPGLDDVLERPAVVRDESFKQRLQRNKQFVESYFDKRAQAKYAGNNPDAALAKAASSNTPEFRSRFADPNHPSNNGKLVSLVTGGSVVLRPGGGRNGRAVGADGKLLPQPRHKIRGPISLIGHGVRKVLADSILYLTVVNMPSPEELEEAKRLLEMDKKGFGEMLKELRGGGGEGFPDRREENSDMGESFRGTEGGFYGR